MKQNRFKSWALWLALGAMVVWIVKTVCNIDISTQVSDCLNLLLPILVGFGIINSPDNKGEL